MTARKKIGGPQDYNGDSKFFVTLPSLPPIINIFDVKRFKKIIYSRKKNPTGVYGAIEEFGNL